MRNNQINNSFAERPAKRILSTILPWLLFTGLTLALSGCGDSPQATINPDGSGGVDTGVYKGPGPASPDVQSFKNEFWEPLRATNRCGSCHNTTQSPMFVNTGDINVAYDFATSVVDVTNPSNSLIVAKVGQGHNCWLGSTNASHRACADIVQGYIANWLGNASGAGRAIALTAPPLVNPGDSRNFPLTAQENGASSFANTVHPLLRDNCAGCHADTSATPQAPLFASSDVDAAYQAAKAKMDIDTPSNSRFVIRLRTEAHNCWSGSCVNDANDMQAAITAFSGAILPTVIDPSLVTSGAMTLGDAIVASGGSRSEANEIARWEFKEGEGNTTAFDTSGVTPAINLSLTGSYEWVSGYGIEFTGGKAQGGVTESKKLHDHITQTGEYAIEAWVVPANVTQEGRSIISYSAGNTVRNFTMAQTMYNYDYLNHTTLADGTDDSKLHTADADEDLQASLQHVVMNFDPVNGRQIFVNGVSTGDSDIASEKGGSVAVWSDIFPLVFGSEQGGGATSWQGKLRFVSIHNRVLSAADIRQNFEAGVGQKYFMLFSVASRTGVAGSYVMFEVEQYDNYSYLFSEPRFINLDSSWTPSAAIAINGMRIGINGKEAVAGQAFANMNATVTAAQYTVDGQLLSSLGTIIALEKGAEADEFFLTFEQLGTATRSYVEADPVTPIAGVDAERVSDIGVRTFDEINTTMSAVTGVPVTNTAVNAIFTSYRRQLPAVENMLAYLSSHQMAVAQLAMTYCDQLVETNPAFFPAFNFGLTPSSAFTNPNAVLNPLLTAIMNVDVVVASKNLATQPNATDISNALSSNSAQDLDAGLTGDSYNSLIDCMTRCERGQLECAIYVDTSSGSTDTPACTATETQNTVARTEQVVKAACAAMLGSAVMLVQ